MSTPDRTSSTSVTRPRRLTPRPGSIVKRRPSPWRKRSCAANIQKRRAEHRHHQPASSAPPQPASPITFQPLVGGSPPVANNDSYAVFHDHALIATTSASGVLANDTDPNGYALTAVEETGPQHGTLTLNSNGTFVYMPSPGYYGADSYTYEAYDGYNYSSPATVSIAVQETAPVANNESPTVPPDHAFNGAISATDSQNDTFTATVRSNPRMDRSRQSQRHLHLHAYQRVHGQR